MGLRGWRCRRRERAGATAHRRGRKGVGEAEEGGRGGDEEWERGAGGRTLARGIGARRGKGGSERRPRRERRVDGIAGHYSETRICSFVSSLCMRRGVCASFYRLKSRLRITVQMIFFLSAHSR